MYVLLVFVSFYLMKHLNLKKGKRIVDVNENERSRPGLRGHPSLTVQDGRFIQ